jgi:hypothetical protein
MNIADLEDISIGRKDLLVWDVVLQKWRFPRNSNVTFPVVASSRIMPLISHIFLYAVNNSILLTHCSL